MHLLQPKRLDWLTREWRRTAWGERRVGCFLLLLLLQMLLLQQLLWRSKGFLLWSSTRAPGAAGEPAPSAAKH